LKALTIGAALAAALVALTTTASAAERKLPATMLGTWCDAGEDTAPDTETYKRGDCLDEPDQWITVRPDGIHGHGYRCQTTAIRKTVDPKSNDIFHLTYRCNYSIGIKPYRTKRGTETVMM
jgi:hypothetical protein